MEETDSQTRVIQGAQSQWKVCSIRKKAHKVDMGGEQIPEDLIDASGWG